MPFPPSPDLSYFKDILTATYNSIQSNGYNLFPVTEIVQGIQDLTNLELRIYNKNVMAEKTITDSQTGLVKTVHALYNLTFVDYQFGNLNSYLIVGSLITTENPSVFPKITFFSVSTGTPIVLISTVLQINAVSTPIILLGTNPYLYFKSKPIPIQFYVSDIDRLREHKEMILNLFAYPSQTFVLWDSFVVHLVLWNNFYQPVFYGKIIKEQTLVQVYTLFEYCAGTLIGRIDHMVAWVYSYPYQNVINFYPFLDNDPNDQQFKIIGGSTNYLLRIILSQYVSGTFPGIVTIANKLDYQNPILGTESQVQTIFLSLPPTPLVFGTAPPTYLIGFSGVNFQYQNIQYAVYQSTDFFNIQETITQGYLSVQIVTCQDPSMSSLFPGIYYLIDTTLSQMTLYFQGEFTSSLLSLRLPVSIDDLVKIPFYTDPRERSENYYSYPYKESLPSKTPPSDFPKHQSLSSNVIHP